VPKNFIAGRPRGRSWQHFARYLKAITLRLDKYRADPARDAAKLAELRPQEQRYWRLVAERKGAVDARMQELRWLLEELRVSFFAQELRTPQPVSVKRLDKLWAHAGQQAQRVPARPARNRSRLAGRRPAAPGRAPGRPGSGQAVLHRRVDGEHVELVHLAELGRQRRRRGHVPTFQPVTWKVLPKLDTTKARAARPG
jgi:hypothetical protein